LILYETSDRFHGEGSFYEAASLSVKSPVYNGTRKFTRCLQQTANGSYHKQQNPHYAASCSPLYPYPFELNQACQTQNRLKGQIRNPA